MVQITSHNLEVVAWRGLLLWPDTCQLWSLAQHQLLCPWQERFIKFKWFFSNPKQYVGLCYSLFLILIPAATVRAMQYTSVTGRAPFVPYIQYILACTHAQTYTQSLIKVKKIVYPKKILTSQISLLLFFCYFGSYLQAFCVFIYSSLTSLHSLPSWYSLLVKHLGVGVIGAGRPKEDQQRKGCSCCGLAACFIIILLPACLEFGAHWLSCKVRNHNFLKDVWVMQLFTAEL